MTHGMLVEQEEFDHIVKDAALSCDVIVTLHDGTKYHLGFGCEDVNPEDFVKKLSRIGKTVDAALKVK